MSCLFYVQKPPVAVYINIEFLRVDGFHDLIQIFKYQRLAARDDNSLRRARRGTFDDGAYVGRRIEPGIPRILGIAPAAPDVATAQTDEVGRLARMAPLALNSIEILDQRQPQTALQHIVRNATVHL